MAMMIIPHYEICVEFVLKSEEKNVSESPPPPPPRWATFFKVGAKFYGSRSSI